MIMNMCGKKCWPWCNIVILKKGYFDWTNEKNSANFSAFFYPMKRRESDSFLMLFLKLRGGINVYYKNNILPLCPIYIYYKNSKD